MIAQLYGPKIWIELIEGEKGIYSSEAECPTASKILSCMCYVPISGPVTNGAGCK